MDYDYFKNKNQAAVISLTDEEEPVNGIPEIWEY
jgi:hypothetical protein